MFNYYTQFLQNWQSSLIMNISRLTAIQRVYCVTQTPSLLFLPVSLAHLLFHQTYQTQQHNRMHFMWSASWKSLRYNFYCKAVQIEAQTTCWKFFLLSWTPLNGKQVIRVRWIVVLSIVTFHCTCAKNIYLW